VEHLEGRGSNASKGIDQMEVEFVEKAAWLLQGVDSVGVVGVVQKIVDVHIPNLEDFGRRAVGDVKLIVIPHRRLACAPRVSKSLTLLLQAPACILFFELFAE
jgi:hypothetical protein